MGVGGADRATTVGSVRAGRASAAERTLIGAELKRPSAFFPPLVRALRRSSAASRLDVLAITTREIENQEEQSNRSADQAADDADEKRGRIRGWKPPAHHSDESVAASLG